MNWLPESIRALTDMLKEVGLFEALTITFFLFLMILVWRHSNAIVSAIKVFLEVKAVDATAREIMSKELNKQTLELNKQTQILTRLDISLNTVCKANCLDYQPVVPNGDKR